VKAHLAGVDAGKEVAPQERNQGQRQSLTTPANARRIPFWWRADCKARPYASRSRSKPRSTAAHQANRLRPPVSPPAFSLARR